MVAQAPRRLLLSSTSWSNRSEYIRLIAGALIFVCLPGAARG